MSTSLSTFDTLLLSKYYDIMYCLYLMVIFAMHLSYGFIRIPCNFRVFEYISYQSCANSRHPYRAFGRHRYSTFISFSTHTFSCVMVSPCTRFPQMFPQSLKFSSGMSELMYAPETPKINTYLPSCASMTRLVKNIPVKFPVRMNLLWLFSISRVVHLRTSSLSIFCSVFLLLGLLTSMILCSVILWGCRGPVNQLPSYI